MKILENKKIILTGGSMGLGYVIAEELSSQGAHLTLISRHEGDLKKASSVLKSKFGGNQNYYCLDVSNRESVKKLAKLLKGGLHGLVNCAGIYGPIGRTAEVDLIQFENTFRVNLLGTLNMCHYLMPIFTNLKKGKIINFAGGGAASAFPHYSAYAVSKIGIVRLTENMALEYKNFNIDINAIAPGFILTRLHQETLKAGKKAGEEFLKKTLDEVEKGGDDPKKAAKLTAFLLSEQSDGITGKFISAIWDLWENPNFLNRLRTDKDFTTIRRIDDKTFFKKI